MRKCAGDERKAQQYEKALILQTVWGGRRFQRRENAQKKKQKHNEMTKKLVSRFKEQGIEGLTMAAGPMGKDSVCLHTVLTPERWRRRPAWNTGWGMTESLILRYFYTKDKKEKTDDFTDYERTGMEAFDNI